LDLGRRPTSAVSALDAKITAQSSKTDHSESHQYYDLDEEQHALLLNVLCQRSVLCTRSIADFVVLHASV
jgi:hypothetical protein